MDWHYHDPGKGRVGPLSADELRTRFRDRRVQPDTLVWREGMREWQPLERVMDELDLLGVKPDANAPPPLPPGPPPGVVGPSTYAAPAYAAPSPAGLPPGYAMRAAPPRQRMSGCLVALIVAGVLAVPAIGILAAIALPAYQDYSLRAKVAQQVDARAPALQSAVLAAMAAHGGRCPSSATDAGVAEAPGLDFGSVDGRCAFRLTLHNVPTRIDGRSVVFVAPATAGDAWDCTGGDLPSKYRSPRCRSDSDSQGPTP